MCLCASVEIKLGAFRNACNVLVIKFDQVTGSDSNADRLIRSTARALVWSLLSPIPTKKWCAGDSSHDTSVRNMQIE